MAALLLATSVALNTAQGQSLQPWLPGPYGVGVRAMTFTKRSVTHPNLQRSLNTSIWYPADPATASLDTHPGGVANAPFAPGLAKAPLVLFSHGACSLPTQYLSLTAFLPSYGFVVAAPPHPGDTRVDPCRANIVDAFVNRPADISFLIDSLLAQSDTPDSFFHDTIDPARIGVMGHSYGGLTTLRVSGSDSRVIAGLALAPGTLRVLGHTVDDEIARITIPIMIQEGDLDFVTPFVRRARYDYDLLRSPRYLVQIAGMGHTGFYDGCGLPENCSQPGLLTQDEAHPLILRYAVSFLLQYVAGDRRFETLLAPAATPPGVEFTADTGGS
jgi:predicted dienelactone hydrolase